MVGQICTLSGFHFCSFPYILAVRIICLESCGSILTSLSADFVPFLQLCVFLYVSLYVSVCVSIYVSVCCSMCICMYVVCMCLCASVSVYLYVCMCVCVSTYVYVFLYVCVYTCVFLCVCVSVCIFFRVSVCFTLSRVCVNDRMLSQYTCHSQTASCEISSLPAFQDGTSVSRLAPADPSHHALHPHCCIFKFINVARALLTAWVPCRWGQAPCINVKKPFPAKARLYLR